MCTYMCVVEGWKGVSVSAPWVCTFHPVHNYALIIINVHRSTRSTSRRNGWTYSNTKRRIYSVLEVHYHCDEHARTYICTYLEDFIELHGSVDLGDEDHHLIELKSIQKIVEFSTLIERMGSKEEISVWALCKGAGRGRGRG